MPNLVLRKQAELVETIIQNLKIEKTPDEAQSEELARAAFTLIQSGVTITPPQTILPRDEGLTIGLVRASSYNTSYFQPDLRGGTSVKPGNLKVDMRKLLVVGAQTIRDVASMIKMPFLIPMTALTIWDRVWSLLSLTISESEAVVIWVMWMNCDDKFNVSDHPLLENVNKELALHGRPPLDGDKLANALSILERMRCIQRSTTHPSDWHLRESVSVEYR